MNVILYLLQRPVAIEQNTCYNPRMFLGIADLARSSGFMLSLILIHRLCDSKTEHICTLHFEYL